MEHIQSTCLDRDGFFGELHKALANVPDVVPKGVSFEDFPSVNDDFVVIVSPSGSDSVKDNMARGEAESTEETENVTRDILILFDRDWEHKAEDATSAALATTASKLPEDVLVSAVANTDRAQVTPLPVPKIICADITRQELLEEQRRDPTLRRCFRKLGKDFPSGNGQSYSFFESNNLLYREYHLATGRKFKQVVVPKKLREPILRVAHESIMAGHQGIRRTTDRILQEFYWPDIHGDVKRFVKSCDRCQRTTPKGKVGVAPLVSTPLIQTPFERVAVDVVGPFSPKSQKGNRYVLTLIDFATRYPDAVALPAIDSAHVAEALIEMFSRIGIPKEIVTDQGVSFTSELMREVSRLLSIKLLRTSPYHAMANGLVEKFNGTLKTMLKILCKEKPRSWDRYIAPLLFAYREVPQASLGFSPFDLIYGRHVRGPLTVLKELWTKDDLNGEVRTTYGYLVDLRDRLEQTCKIAHEQLGKAKEKQKDYYDRKSRPRKLSVGNKVLILLPTDSNKLLMQSKGPFEITGKKNDVDYEISLGGKRKVFHVNMLKLYEERTSSPPSQASVAATIDDVPATPDDLDDPPSADSLPTLPLRQTQTCEDVKLSPELNAEQRAQVHEVIQKYGLIFSDLPGKTDVVHCPLNLTTDKPVHDSQYPLPLALHETIEKEVQDMLAMGIIEKSQSPYNAPLVAIKKPDGTIRLCIDFRELNKLLVSDCEPIPRIDVVLALAGKKKFFSKFDFTKGYWQVPMSADSCEKTAFSSLSGLYHFRYMPFGIKTAPAVFARLMRAVLGGLKNVHHYFDDVIVATDTWQEHLDTLGRVFERIKNANLTIKPKLLRVSK
ncbi:uncharacterized protein LOC144165881 [Haemaphysalis longicornis]